MAKNAPPEKIRQRVPYGVPKLQDYELTSYVRREADRLESLINRRVRQLKRQGIDISTCPDYLDSLIEAYIASLFSSLENRHRMQKSYIRTLFVRRASDKIEYENLLARLEEEIATTKVEYDIIERIYRENNPLYKGRLRLDAEPFIPGNDDDEGGDNDE